MGRTNIDPAKLAAFRLWLAERDGFRPFGPSEYVWVRTGKRYEPTEAIPICNWVQGKGIGWE